MKGSLKSLALLMLEEGLTNKQVAKMLKVKHQWLLAVVNSPLPEFNFGVELETLYEGKLQLPREFKMFYGVGYHSTDGADISNQYHWRQTYDGSLGCCGEYVSPILQGKKGLEILSTFCESLNKVKAKVDKKCGLHVHIDRKHFSGEEHIQRFVKLYAQLETSLDAIMPKSRRESNNEYCLSVVGNTGRTRYAKVNLENSATVEVRHHSGTIDFQKIKNWILILSSMIEESRKSKLTSCTDVQQVVKGSVAEYVKQRKVALA